MSGVVAYGHTTAKSMCTCVVWARGSFTGTPLWLLRERRESVGRPNEWSVAESLEVASNQKKSMQWAGVRVLQGWWFQPSFDVVKVLATHARTMCACTRSLGGWGGMP